MTESGVGPRRDAIVARLRAARTGYERCVGDVSPEIGMDGTEWSILDLLHHSIDSGYQDMVRRFVEESTPEFSGVYDPAADWRQATENMLGSIDTALSLANSLTPDQMSRVGHRRGQPFTVLDALELDAAHFEEHLAQLRDEIRPRQGLPPLSP